MATEPRKVPQRRPMSDGLRGELVGIMVSELDFTQDEARAIDLKVFRSDFREFLMKYRPARRMPTALIQWSSTYNRLFGKVPDLSSVVIPPKPEGVGPMRLIVVAREIIEWTDNHLLQGTQNALGAHFACCRYTDSLDEAITKSDRNPRDGSYALWVRDVREADEEFADKSVNDLVAMNHLGITMLERLLMEADYFWERGEHLDIENVTLCAGSRYRDGRVPDAYWNGAEFGAYWYDLRYHDPSLRSRRVWI